jgi:hypothetical protein
MHMKKEFSVPLVSTGSKSFPVERSHTLCIGNSPCHGRLNRKIS